MKLFGRLFAVCALALVIAGAATTANAQVAVYNSYVDSINVATYNSIDGINTVLNKDNFVTPLSYYQGGPQTDYDNGVYFAIPIGFTFVFNGTGYSTVNICVNGWINFTTVPFSTNNQLSMFNQNLPNAMIAPFFGDHYLRPDTTQGFVASNISYALTGLTGNKSLTIQWENLNVNYLNAPFPKQSVASFQLTLHQNGSFEFAYGPISSGNVQTGGCAVGIKDQNGQSRMNALFVTASDPLDSVRYSTLLSSRWPPSRQPGRVIRFTPFGSEINNWGDGDADLSQGPGIPQNIFVNNNDVLTILRSIATGVQMDSVFGRSAFHADVNHNGRFILINGVRSYDTTRTNDPQFQHPNDIIYFHATSYDAALIQLYLAGKLPELPWIYDTVPPFGKAGVNVPPALTFGKTLSGAPGTVTVPIMAQGTGAIGADFQLSYGENVHLLKIQPVSTSGTSNRITLVEHNNNVSIAIAGNFFTPTTVANATFEITGNGEDAAVSTNGLTVNDEMAKDITAPLTSQIGGTELSAYPNPFNFESNTQIAFSTVNDGYVDLKVYDVLGNVVRTLVSGVQAHGLHSVSFDGRTDAGMALPAGVYYYRLNVDGVSLTKQLSYVK